MEEQNDRITIDYVAHEADMARMERDREILKDRFIDGLTFEQLAERHDVSTRTVKNVIYKHEYIILKYAKREQG